MELGGLFMASTGALMILWALMSSRNSKPQQRRIVGMNPRVRKLIDSIPPERRTIVMINTRALSAPLFGELRLYTWSRKCSACGARSKSAYSADADWFTWERTNAVIYVCDKCASDPMEASAMACAGNPELWHKAVSEGLTEVKRKVKEGWL